MLYGCDTWKLSKSHLETIQAEIRKCILGISKYHSNVSTLIGPNYWRKMTVLAYMFFEQLCQMMYLRSASYNNAAHWNNVLVLVICSYVLRILMMHAPL